MGKNRKRADEHAEVVLQALSHQLRRRIMRLVIAHGNEAISPREASRLLDVRLSTISYHFRVLAKSRALDKTGERPVRGAVQHFYRANRTAAKMPMVTEVLAATSGSD